jgi:hypothetical protein
MKGLGAEGLPTGYSVRVQQSIDVNPHPFQNILTAAQQHQVHDNTRALQVNARHSSESSLFNAERCAVAAISGASPVLNRLGKIQQSLRFFCAVLLLHPLPFLLLCITAGRSQLHLELLAPALNGLSSA